MRNALDQSAAQIRTTVTAISDDLVESSINIQYGIHTGSK